MMPLESDLQRVQQLAAARHDEFEVLRYLLELDDDIDDARLDALVEEIAAPIRAAIDCTKCANCCRTLTVYMTPEDAKLLADGLGTPPAEVIRSYIDPASSPDEDAWRLRFRPCCFLEGKLCSVYAHRPDACRIYPSFAPDFRWTLENTLDGAGICPIIYNVLSQLSEQYDALVSRMRKDNPDDGHA